MQVFIALINLPGSAPMYVRRCPFISASSRIPPREKRKYLRPKALAIDCPTEVLPVPGGPTSKTIEPAKSPLMIPTDINSKILSLTSLRP